MRQRILGALKEASPSVLGLKTGDAADAPLTVQSVPHGFHTTALLPVPTAQSVSADPGLQLKLGDAAQSSMQAGQGFDTTGKMPGSDLPPPPPAPSSRPTAEKTAEKVEMLKILQAQLKNNDTAEQALKDQLGQLQQAPTPDPVAIHQVQAKIAVKEQEKKKIMLDLTAADPDVPDTGQSADPETTPATTIPTGVSP